MNSLLDILILEDLSSSKDVKPIYDLDSSVLYLSNINGKFKRMYSNQLLCLPMFDLNRNTIKSFIEKALIKACEQEDFIEQEDLKETSITIENINFYFEENPEIPYGALVRQENKTGFFIFLNQIKAKTNK